MLRAIATARTSVYLEVYAFFLDEVGKQFVAALTEARQRSVEVSVIIDGLGSRGHSGEVLKVLTDIGCAATIYHPMLSAFLGRLRRNHRKILLIDEEVAFVGGINIGAPYHGKSVSDYADLAVEIRGPACADLALELGGGRAPRAAPIRFFLSRRSGSFRLRKRYLKAIASAKQRMLIAHGYFLPDRRMLRSITAAARRGVAVSLLVAGRSDIPLVQAATSSYYIRLLRAGVRIYEWQTSVLHSKVATIDDGELLIGSFNLDPFSLFNLEILVEMDDPAATLAAGQWISDRIALGRPVGLDELVSSSLRKQLRRWIGHLGARLAHAVRRLLTSRAS